MSHPANRTIIWILISVVVACLLLFCCASLVGVVALCVARAYIPQDYGLSAGLRVGDTAPDFTIYLINGDRVTLSDYRGQPVFVNFWATWCQYCLEEMPMIQDRFERYSGEMVFLVIDQGEYSGDVSNFVQQEGYPFPVGLDPTLFVGDMYFVDGYPVSFFIDSEGIIRYIANGMMEEYDMNDGLQALGIDQ